MTTIPTQDGCTGSPPYEWPAKALDPWWIGPWEEFGAEYRERVERPPATEDEFRRELVFCLLGGHSVAYELARSAAEVVAALDPFDPGWTAGRLEWSIEAELATAQFDPPRVDGTPRRYRFPVRKSRLLVRAVWWVRDHGQLTTRLGSIAAASPRRQWLMRCPGLGAKSASWLLRNTGWASELAILDVHVLRAMYDAGLVEDDQRLPRDYENLETTFVSWATALGAPAAALDVFLWDAYRTVRPNA